MAAGRMLIIGGWCVWLALAPGCSESEPPPAQSTAEISSDTTASESREDVLDVTIKDETFTLELAMDDDTRLQGLSDRPEIDEHGGMLFVFPDEARREFVMRRCLVPIDIAYLNARGEVVWMHAMQVESDPNVPEYRLKRYDSHYPAQFAIELRDGSLRRLGLKQGDRIDLPLEDLKSRAR